MKKNINSYAEVLELLETDEQFKRNFMADPKIVLAEIGVNIPESVKIEVHEDSSNVKNFVLPLKSEYQQANFNQMEPNFQALIQRSWEDDDFKYQMLHNSKAAFKEVTGIDLPDTLEVCVYENTPKIKHLIVPNQSTDEELNDLELMAIAGGAIRILGYFPLEF